MRYRLRWKVNPYGKRIYYREFVHSDGPSATPQGSGETPSAPEPQMTQGSGETSTAPGSQTPQASGATPIAPKPQTPQGSGCGCGTLLLLLVLLSGGGVFLVHRYAPDWFDKARDLLRNATSQSSRTAPAESSTGQPDAAQPEPTPAAPAPPPAPPAKPSVKDDGNRLFIPR